ncbi:hypothetical protein HDV00_004404 [Rhizophlyctis rosea]|nr:hypothetical protein HDV00_004404 [Rhizophlyctis rosea]
MPSISSEQTSDRAASVRAGDKPFPKNTKGKQKESAPSPALTAKEAYISRGTWNYEANRPMTEAEVMKACGFDSSEELSEVSDEELSDVEEVTTQEVEWVEDLDIQPTTPLARRSTRKRVADQAPSLDHFSSVSPVDDFTSRADSSPRPTRKKAKRPRLEQVPIESLLNDRSSQLGEEETNLKALFNYEIFLSFSLAEQAELASFLPDVDTIPMPESSVPSESSSETSPTSSKASDPLPTPRRTIPPKFFKNNRDLGECIDLFQELLRLGYYETDQQELMLKDVEKTKKEYDAWKEEHFEDVWGEKLDPALTEAIAASAKSIDLAELFRAKVLVDGDTLRFKRRFAHKDVTVEKDVKIMRSNGKIVVHCDKRVWKNIDTPTRIENLILDYDGRVMKGERPNGNAWKVSRDAGN